MTIEETRETHPPAAVSQNATPVRAPRGLSRIFAIPMTGFGAAICASIEPVQAQAPEFAAVPGIAGPALALVGLLLLLRSQLQQARFEKARKLGCRRIARYVPVMADGSNGSASLNAVLAPAGEIASAPPHRQTLARAQAATRAPARRNEIQNGGTVKLFPSTRRRAAAPSQDRPSAASQRRAPSAALADGIHFGGDWAQDLDLSPRARARLEADPFVQRLARIG